jgi:hypothetical protein
MGLSFLIVRNAQSGGSWEFGRGWRMVAGGAEIYTDQVAAPLQNPAHKRWFVDLSHRWSHNQCDTSSTSTTAMLRPRIAQSKDSFDRDCRLSMLPDM